MAKWKYERLDAWVKSKTHGWDSPDVAARFEAGTRAEHFLELFTFGAGMTEHPAAKEFGSLVRQIDLREAVFLDFGCGNAVYKELLSALEPTRRWKYVGADVNPASIESCRLRYPGDIFEVVEEDHDLPFCDQFADVILVSGVLEYFEHPVAMLREFQRVSTDWVMLCRIAVMPNRPSAIYRQTVHHDWGMEQHTLRVFNRRELAIMIEQAGLEIVLCEVSPSNGVLDWVAPDEPPVEHFSYLLRKLQTTAT